MARGQGLSLAELWVAQVPAPLKALESEAEVGVMLLPAMGQDGWGPPGAAGGRQDAARRASRPWGSLLLRPRGASPCVTSVLGAPDPKSSGGGWRGHLWVPTSRRVQGARLRPCVAALSSALSGQGRHQGPSGLTARASGRCCPESEIVSRSVVSNGL